MAWWYSPERNEKLRELYETHSAREIMEMSGAPSRNAVIGLAHRLGLRASLSRLKNRNGTIASGARKPPKPIKTPRPGKIALLDLKNSSCRWPTGDNPPFLFCGLPRAPGQAYCSAHCEVAFKPNSAYRKRSP